MTHVAVAPNGHAVEPALAEMRIASVDAVDGQLIRATLSIDARGTPVRGAYVTIAVGDDLLLGRIISVTLSNAVHDDPTFSVLIMTNGRVPNWSGEIDIETAEVETIRAVDIATRQFIPLRRNPPSGSPIVFATTDTLEQFHNERRHFLRVGEIPNSGGLPATIINRSFALYGNDGADLGGYGEARHELIVGQNGSGKTVWATVLLAGKLAAHPNMGCFIPDTAGDLSDPTRHNRGDFRWNYQDVLRAAGVELEIINIDQIRLTSKQLLQDQIQRLFRQSLAMASEQARTLAQRVADTLFDRDVVVAELTSDAVLNVAADTIGPIYSKASRQDKVDDVVALRDTPRRRQMFDRQFERIRRFFDGREPLDALIREVLLDGRKVIIRMDGLPEVDQEHVMHEVMTKLHSVARQQFMTHNQAQFANALVVLDEAARWVPEGSDAGELAEQIKVNARETRKYGVGWWFISQRTATISKSIMSEAHTKWFGRNLGIGADRKNMEDTLGKVGMEEYDRLSAQGGYFWIGVGLDSNVGSEGTYMSVHPFGGDSTRALINANSHIFR